VTDDEARDTLLVTRETTVRLTLAAIELARKRAAATGSKPSVTIVDKSNALRSFAFMRKVFMETCATQPDVEARSHYVDAMALDLVRRPWDFGVLVVENLCGDILSDLAAALIGGLGFAPSAEIGPRNALFQPCHGTAPDIAGRDIANPAAAILSAAMMLDYLADRHSDERAAAAARTMRAAVDHAFGERLVKPADIGGSDGTATVAGRIADLCSEVNV
jgi:3-isopropylmalate dehydrogenase